MTPAQQISIMNGMQDIQVHIRAAHRLSEICANGMTFTELDLEGLELQLLQAIQLLTTSTANARKDL
jgi:hypothetical protein